MATIFFRLWRKWAETKFLLKLQNQFFLHMQLKTGLLKAWASLIVQLVKNPSAVQEIAARFLGQKDPLEKGKATHSSIFGLSLWLSW